MPSRKNRVIIACAGSGKTTKLVTEALADHDRRIAIVTYTNHNKREIAKRFGEQYSGIPKHVDVMTWFEFLLRECARPYQRAKYVEKRIESLLFVKQRSAPYIKEAETGSYYFANGELIYSDKIAQFVVECEKRSFGAVTARIGQAYAGVYVDEFQDLAGWDLEVIEMLLKSELRVTLVGDPRQHIYSTNQSQKNKQYLGIKLVERAKKWEKNGLCSVEYMSATHRCSSAICKFCNALWPGMEAMTSLRHQIADHDGVFLVGEGVLTEYMRTYKSQVLRYDKNAKTYGYEAVNFGVAKGLEFERVLIVPTTPIKKFLQTGDLRHIEQSKEKLYVAVTRAFHSVAFVFNDDSPLVSNRWIPCTE